MAIANLYKQDEILWQHITDATGSHFIVTSNFPRTSYFIYKLVEGRAQRLGKAASPPVLLEKYTSWEV